MGEVAAAVVMITDNLEVAAGWQVRREPCRTRFPMPVAAVCVVALVGCSGAAHRAARGDSSPSPGVSATPTHLAATATTSRVGLLSRGSCVSTQLRLSSTRGVQHRVTQYVYRANTYYVLTNRGAKACSLYGYPRVDVLDQHGRLIQRPATPLAAPDAGVATVVLKPGSRAVFLLSSVDTLFETGVNTWNCPVMTWQHHILQVYPPGVSSPIAQPYTGISCDLQVGPVRTVKALPASATPQARVIGRCTLPAPSGLAAKARPTEIVITCGDGRYVLESLMWTTWSAVSVGDGDASVYRCSSRDSCGFTWYPVQVTLYAPTNTAEGPLFTRASMRFHGVGPDGTTTEQFNLPVPPA